jgi:hypothetical protein
VSVDPQWSTPPTPPGGPLGDGREPIRAVDVWVGIGMATLGHLLTIVITVVSLAFRGDLGLFVGFGSQVLLFVACLTLGIVQLTRPVRRGLGLGLLIGWGVGVIVLPVVGVGACIYMLSRIETG